MKRQDQNLADNARGLRAWKAFHRDERETVLAGPHARTLAELFRMFANLECVQPAQLIGFIGAINWSEIDFPTRLTTLHEINQAITKWRERQGLDPIDDPLPFSEAPENAFRIIRGIVSNQFPASAGKPRSGNG